MATEPSIYSLFYADDSCLRRIKESIQKVKMKKRTFIAQNRLSRRVRPTGTEWLSTLVYLWSPCAVLLPWSRGSWSGSPPPCASGQIRRRCTRECCPVLRRSPAVHSHRRFSPLALRTTGRVVRSTPHFIKQLPVFSTWACQSPLQSKHLLL